MIGRQMRRATSFGGKISIDDVEIEDFFDGMVDEDLSFDGLGQGSTIKKVKKEITNIADADLLSEQSSKKFVGWCASHASKWKFRFFDGHFYSAPTHNNDGTVRNPYHINLSRDGYRQKGRAYALATTLYQRANMKGWIEHPVR